MCVSPTKIRDPHDPFHNSFMVPCGKCIECKLDYTNSFAIRIMHESLSHEKNCFITLTYNDESLHVSQEELDKYIDLSIDKIKKLNSTLSKFSRESIECLHFKPCDRNYKSLHRRDAQLFLKKLRKKYTPKCPFNPITQHKEYQDWQDKYAIRYFLCGEYGGTFGRKHFHAILFNFYPDDVYFDKFSHRHRSPALEELWQYGFVDIGSVTYKSARYVASYIVKQKFGRDSVYYDVNNLEPEFVLMSQGIGRPYIKQKEKSEQLKAQGFIRCNNHKAKMPRYYENKLYNEEERKVRYEIKSHFIEEARKAFEKSLDVLDFQRDSARYREIRGFPLTYGEWCERKRLEKVKKRDENKQELVERKRKDKNKNV